MPWSLRFFESSDQQTQDPPASIVGKSALPISLGAWFLNYARRLSTLLTSVSSNSNLQTLGLRSQSESGRRNNSHRILANGSQRSVVDARIWRCVFALRWKGKSDVYRSPSWKEAGAKAYVLSGRDLVVNRSAIFTKGRAGRVLFYGGWTTCDSERFICLAHLLHSRRKVKT